MRDRYCARDEKHSDHRERASQSVGEVCGCGWNERGGWEREARRHKHRRELCERGAQRVARAFTVGAFVLFSPKAPALSAHGSLCSPFAIEALPPVAPRLTRCARCGPRSLRSLRSLLTGAMRPFACAEARSASRLTSRAFAESAAPFNPPAATHLPSRLRFSPHSVRLRDSSLARWLFRDETRTSARRSNHHHHRSQSGCPIPFIRARANDR